MDRLEKQIKLKLIANIIEDWCAHQSGIVFETSLCTQERCIRFTTPMLESIFPSVSTSSGVWKSGHFLMYEIYNETDHFQITASVSYAGLTVKQKKDCCQLLESSGIPKETKRGMYFLKVWNYDESAGDAQKIMNILSDFYEYEMPYFESELAEWKKNHSRIIKPFPALDNTELTKQDIPDGLLIEGAMRDILTNRYERNPEARKKCIAVNGTACKICGFDFGDAYGAIFSGKIEVHHKVPLSQIREDYVVDPVNDLIPVCPNCHMVLHSKPGGGYYTPEEVQSMLKEQGSTQWNSK